MPRNRDAYNTTGGPIVVTDEGHTIGGGEHGRIDPENQLAADAVAAGLLILAADRAHPEADEPTSDPAPPVADVLAASSAGEPTTTTKGRAR